MAMPALSTAATGMLARELDISVIAHNIANISTTGFKRQRAEFQDLLYQTSVRPGVNSSDTGTIVPTGMQVGLGTKAAGIYHINEQGPLVETKNPYDVAIRDHGMFRIQMPDGSYSYTRAGSFRLSPTSEIVNDKGYIVTPGLVIPPQTLSITINDSGQVIANISGSLTPVVVGQFDLVDFPNVSGLSAMGDNLFAETAASGSPIVGIPNTNGMGSLLQGWLESSNTDAVTELTKMIEAQRGYELCSKIISTADEMMRTAVQSKS